MAALGAAIVVALSVACSGDEILGPPDSGRCVAGTLSTDAAKPGHLGASSCVLWSPWNYNFGPAQSWTLRMEADRAYIVRLIPTDTAPGARPLNAFLAAYGRNAQGDAGLEAVSGCTFGSLNRSHEMVLTSTTARTMSIRAEAMAPDDSGSYVIEVSSCALLHITMDSLHTGINSTAGCAARGMHNGARSRVTLMQFEVESVADIDLLVRRVAGNAAIRSYYSGYSPHISSVHDDGVFDAETPITTQTGLHRTQHERTGLTLLALSVHADSGATMSVQALPTPSIRAPLPH
jgi:hypothetical protein